MRHVVDLADLKRRDEIDVVSEQGGQLGQPANIPGLKKEVLVREELVCSVGPIRGRC